MVNWWDNYAFGLYCIPLHPFLLDLVLVGKVIEGKNQKGNPKNVDVVSHNTKSHGDQDCPNIEGMLHVGVGTRCGKNFVFLKVSCRPKPQHLSQGDDGQPQTKG